MKIHEIPIIVGRSIIVFLVLLVRWILPFVFIVVVIGVGITTFLSNWGIHIGDIGETIAFFVATAGAILIFMGYRHLKCLSVNRDELIYDLEEKFDLLSKLEKLQENEELLYDELEDMGDMISGLRKVLQREKKRREYDNQEDLEELDAPNSSLADMATKEEKRNKRYFKNEKYKQSVLDCFHNTNADTLTLTQITTLITSIDRDANHWTLLALYRSLKEGKLEKAGRNKYRLTRSEERRPKDDKRENKKRTVAFSTFRNRY